jgi:hypothetical protein
MKLLNPSFLKSFLNKILSLRYYRFSDGLYTSNTKPFKNYNFTQAYQCAMKKSNLPYDPNFYYRLHQLLWAFDSINRDSKAYCIVELGTGRGFMMHGLAYAAKDSKHLDSILMFDTFLPFKTDKKTGKQNSSIGKSVFYANTYRETLMSFESYRFCRVVQGKCPETLIAFKDYFRHFPIRLLHVDLNYYKAEIDSLELLFQYLDKKYIILLDDYANFGRELQAKAFNDFFASKGKAILTTAAGQGIVIS